MRNRDPVKTISLLLVLALGVPAAWGRSLSSLRSDARLLAKDTGSARQRFTNAQIDDWINEGARAMMARAWCLQSSREFELVAGTTYYSLPSDFLAVRRLTRENLQLQEATPEALDSRSRGWEAATGIPTYYFINLSSPNVIGFAPAPSTSVDTGTIKMDYYAMSDLITTDASTPLLSTNRLAPYHHALSYYAASRMAAIDGRQTVAATYVAIFEQYQKTLTESCRDRPNYLPSATGRP